MVAMLYPDHPHAKAWLDHAIRQFREGLRIYVIPGSGKWAENIGNYYDWSSVVLGSLAHGLHHTGAADPFAWPEWQDFWRWALPTMMPPKPGREDTARLERGEIIEPYWGKATPGQGQISWRGEDRAGGGLNTNACWRNPDFIAGRMEWLRRVAAAVRAEPRAHQRILGYVVWNEQRWAWGDETCYCPHCTAAWAKWLAAHYKTIAALNREYGTAFATFDEVPLPKPIDGKPLAETTKKNSRPTSVAPPRDVTSVPAWRDFHLFKADGLIEFEKLGAAAMKKADPDRLVITSLFSRDVHPNIGHVMLRLYRELGADPNIGVIGGNSYEVLPECRSARHLAMWRSIPADAASAAHRKPIWFTEFNDHGLPIDRPCTPAMVNCLIARTAFSGGSGLIWFTADAASARTTETAKFGVLETDGAISERWRTISAAHAAMERNAGLIAETARNDLPRQVAVVHLDQWNALADNEYYDAASQSALDLLGIRAGCSVAYLAEPEVLGGELGKYPLAVLWQAQRQGDLDDTALAALRKYVERGGTLVCDLPLVQDADGRGPAGAADRGGRWAEFAGLTFANEQPRNVLDLADPGIGRIQLRASGTAFPAMAEPQSLSQWDIQPAAGTDVIADSAGRPAIVIRKLGGDRDGRKGSVVTLGLKLALIDPDADNREMAAKLLRALIVQAGVQPLVDLPWLEKTIAPLDGGGLLVTVFNGHASAVNSTLRLPQHRAAKIQPVRVPRGAAVSAESVTLPAGEWLAFTVR